MESGSVHLNFVRQSLQLRQYGKRLKSFVDASWYLSNLSCLIYLSD